MKFRIAPYLAGLSAVLLVMAGVEFLDRSEKQRFREITRANVLNQLSITRAHLEGELNQKLFITQEFVPYISATNPYITQEEFQNIVRRIALQNSGIGSIVIFKDGKVTHFYNVPRQEINLSIDPMIIPEQRKAFERAIKTRRTILAGPIKLLPSEKIGFITYTPLFVIPTNKPSLIASSYWGMASISIDANVLFKEAGLFDTDGEIIYAIRGKDGLGADGEIVFGDEKIFDLEPVVLSVNFPNGSWLLAAIPAQGWPVVSPWSRSLWIGGSVISLLMGFIVFKLVRDPGRMEELVERATSALIESESKYRELVENASSIILRIDTQGKITFFNEFAQSFFGYSEAEILGKNLIGTIVPPKDTFGNDLGAMIKDFLEHPEQYTCMENENIRRNGERVWIAWRNKLVRDYKDKVTGILAIGTDITDRHCAEVALQQAKIELEIRVQERTAELRTANEQLVKEIAERQQTEEELKESEERWQLALRGNNDGIWDWNLRTNEVFFSLRYKEMLGYTDEEIPNQLESWANLLHPEDTTWVIDVMQNHLDQKNPYYVAEYRMRCKDDSYKWILARGQAVWDAQGKPIRMVGSHTDITDRKHAEAALRQSETRERERAVQLELALLQLQRSQAQLIQSEKMSSLGQMVAGIAHEINNPVNFIHGNLTYLNDYTRDLLELVKIYQQEYPENNETIQECIDKIELDFLVEDMNKILASMKIGTERIRQIVLSLRNFSRLDESEMKPVDIHEGIESTLLILQNRLKLIYGRLEIQVIKEFSKLPAVECYAGQLNQVFMNILSNAIDAFDRCVVRDDWMSPGNTPNYIPTIWIRTQKSRGDRVKIEIKDNGMGMTQEVQNQIFNPFYTTKEVGKGTGLGLSISYQIVVEKHGGSLKCLSTPGEGSTFQIEIPIRPIK